MFKKIIPANCDKYSAESLCGRYSNIITSINIIVNNLYNGNLIVTGRGVNSNARRFFGNLNFVFV